ncbi:DUF3443 domain-containing protein [Noviherbaspirillum pedocola]|uniref:DUF3443 domain-containing protein n=1 Tax=Noviherbaspirillum pedocola TaxID=2801341 RepID=A0A934W6D0_9BURK|nr:DUF3443 domain-containing protein [Noviherbaspirillum pedocola]MBK4734218.1 DUF3443 domain-containing protein [Noviherbaspirillum pedocola]
MKTSNSVSCGGNALRRSLAAASLGLLFVLAACGGGGNDSGSSSGGSSDAAQNSAPRSTTPTSGSGTSGSTAQDGTALAANAVSVVVDAGPAGNTVNVPYTSVTICAPGTNRCQTIDHMIVDTGSSGIRVFSSLLDPSLGLPQQSTSAGALGECTQFADSSVWGPVRLADVRIGGETAASLPVQTMSDPNFANIPSACSSTGVVAATVQSFGGNGIIGIGPQREDCGSSCAQSANIGVYYACSSSTCQGVAVPAAQQVSNPVAKFAVNNNGVLLKMPSLPGGTVGTAIGTLVFGIGTAGNNGLGNATVYTISASTGTFTTVYKGRTFRSAFIDSGSNGYFFNDTTIPACSSGFYCPPSSQTLTATNTGLNNASGTVNFTVANAQSLFSTNNTAFDSLGGSGLASTMFDWGLPFFFGRNVFTAIEGASTSGGTGPYFAY